MVIASTDEIKYETRESNIIAFGSPWPIPSNLQRNKYKLSQQKKPPVIFLLTVPRRCFFCGSF